MHVVAVDSYCKQNSHNNVFGYCGCFVCNTNVEGLSVNYNSRDPYYLRGQPSCCSTGQFPN